MISTSHSAASDRTTMGRAARNRNRNWQHLLRWCLLLTVVGSCWCSNETQQLLQAGIFSLGDKQQHAEHYQGRSLATNQSLEEMALLQFKAEVDEDPRGILNGWVSTGSNTSPCGWTGVSCDGGGEVTSVVLNDLALGGRLGLAWVAALPGLKIIDLSGNSFTGNLSVLPSGNCRNFEQLNLAGNLLDGSVPPTMLTGCGSLLVLNLSRNALAGSLPSELFTNCGALEILDLSGNLLVGGLPDGIGLCSSLQQLRLSSNRFDGVLPPNLLSNCSVAGCSSGPPFASVDLSNNDLSGSIPDQFLSNCATLLYLDLSSNQLSGVLPTSLQTCAKLTTLNLTSNKLGPSLPDFVVYLTSIEKLHLAQNQFVGPISSELISALCPTLQELDLSYNNVTGTLPSSLAACNNLQVLNFESNKMSGEFPSQYVAPLQSLEVLRFAFNEFTGPVPVAVMNCSSLRILDFGGNALIGAVPAQMCPPSNEYVLEQLLLADNKISGEVPASLSNCIQLVILDLSMNQLRGGIPVELAQLPNLERISLWYTGLTGPIPPELGNLPKLRNLNLNNNQLSGNIPSQLSNCTNLEWLNLNSNELTGSIPPELGLLQKLALLELGNNSLTGPIPPELGNCSNLLWLDVNTNQLNGSIPKALGRLATSSLSSPVLVGDMLGFVRNGASSCKGFGMGIMLDFTGITREDVLGKTPFTSCAPRPTLYVGGSLYDNPDNRTIQYLDLSFNQLSGSIPEEMGSWVSLAIVALSHNQLTGVLPATFTNLRNVGVMDLSHNLLEGSLSVLSSWSLLVAIDVSFNQFSGPIPSGQLSTYSSQSFADNAGLCDTPLPPCNGTGNDTASSQQCTGSGCPGGSRTPFLTLASSIVLGVLVSLLCVSAFLAWIVIMMKNRQRNKENALLSSLQQSSCNGSSSWNLSGEREPLSINVATFERPLRKLTFSQLIEATNGFSQESLVGTGGFGEVYKAELKDGSTVAIKKLVRFSCQGDREFMAEMETLGKIKHRNLVPLLGYCKVGEERLLVYEFMQGGSLDEVLHGSSDGRERLTWDLRKQIAKGAARGLAFLHHNCIPHIIHRDMKSSNVLLDKDMEARVSDFGMARLISALDTHLSVSTLAGTPGYVPPEYYQSFRCTTKGDIYSFGVILLELLTGKRSTDKEEFGDSNLVGWVKLHVASQNSLEVLDPVLRGIGAEYEMIQYLNIACDCLDDVPARRPTMVKVVAMFKELVYDER